MNRKFCLVALWTFGAALLVSAASLVTSVSNAPGVSAAGNSFAPVLSSDGRRVFFVSHAPNLRTNEVRYDTLQLFVRDLLTSNVTLLSTTTNGQPADADFTKFNISSNGQFVVFNSEANNLVAVDSNNIPDIFLRDIAAQTNRLVTVNRFGFITQQGSSTNQSVPLLSADGRYVFFESGATDLTQENEIDQNQAADIYRRDMQSNVTILVNAGYQWPYNPPGFGGSALASITPDGRKVVFTSSAGELVPGVSPGNNEVYVRDLVTRTTVRASFNVTDVPPGYRYPQAAISDDGRYVAFLLKSPNGWPVDSVLYLRDLQTSALVALATNLSSFQFSADARYVLFEDGTNIFRLDTTTLSNELVNVTLSGASTNGVARDGVMTPDGNGIVFNSDQQNLTANTVEGFHLYARDMAAGATRLLTLATNGQPSATHKLPGLFSVTRDLTRVAFDSSATDLVNGDENRASDVFLRDVTNETTTLISMRASGGPRQTSRAHAFINSDSLSADGRILAFTSYDGDLLPHDTNGWPDLFVRDLTTGQLTTPGFSTNAAYAPAVSADGRYVVYLRQQVKYASEINGGAVFRFNRQAGVEELVSPVSASVRPAISSNGQWIAFLSNTVLVARDMNAAATWTIGTAEANLGRDAVFTPDGARLLFTSTAQFTPNSGTNLRNLFAWNTTSHSVALVSQHDGSEIGVGGSFCVSDNSRFAAYSSSGIFALYRHDLIAGTNQFLRNYAWRPAISGDGAAVACVTQFEFPQRLLIFHANTGEELPVTNSGPFNTSDWFKAPLFSPDGRWLVYSRRGFTEVNGRPQYSFHLFAWDRLLRTHHLISRNLTGTNANANVVTAALATHGRTVVFHSVASDLVGGDDNDKLDIFAFSLGGGDVDADGLDDDWEVAYFGNLSRDGNGDFDADGASDRAEFLSVTDPTNVGSVFRVLTLVSVNSATRQLNWQGNPVRSHRVEYKDDLNAPNWNPLYGGITWDGSTASIQDSPPQGTNNRYYRVVLLP